MAASDPPAAADRSAPSLVGPIADAFRSVSLSPEDEAAYEAERIEHNRRMVRGLAWLLLPLHGLTVVAYLLARSTTPELDLYARTVILIHVVAIPCTAWVSHLVVRVSPRVRVPWSGWAADVYSMYYMLIATALSINAQRLNGNVNVFMLGILLTATILRPRAGGLVMLTLTSVLALAAGVIALQPQAATRLAVLSPAVAACAIALLVAHLQRGAARRELAARLELERRRAELAAQQRELRGLNDELERRVADQVGEIVTHAQEIERLNQHLRAQIADRSLKLAQALSSLDRACPPLAQGDVLDGRVEIVERLASGGMGEVYRGLDRVLGRQVAVKVPQADTSVGRELWLRFANEARAAATVSHPAVVRTLHVGIAQEGRLYQLQDLVEGTSLEALLTHNEPWPAAHAARIGAVLAEGLAAAHAAGIVHRDVKPSNVMLCDKPPGVQLLDFGVSRLYDEIGRATMVGTIVGTPRYMAPEQIMHPEQTGAPADVYALGVLLHELITGASPFQGTAIALLDHHLREPAPRLDEALAPAALAELVHACMDKCPESRPTAQELAEQLRALADADGVPPAERLPRPRPRVPDSRADQAETVRLPFERSA